MTMDENESKHIGIGKGIATAAMWIGTGIAIGASSGNNAANIYTTIIAFMIIAAATISTGLIWHGSGISAAIMSEKNKRKNTADSRTDLLIKLLTDEDRAMLRNRLVNDVQSDGEMLPLAELLASENEKNNY